MIKGASTKILLAIGLILVMVGALSLAYSAIWQRELNRKVRVVEHLERAYEVSGIDELEQRVESLEKSLASSEENVEILSIELLTSRAALKHAKHIVEWLTGYVNVLCALCDANDISYPPPD